MKKNIINKIIFSLVTLICFFAPSLFAKDLYYKAELLNSYSENTMSLRWTNYVKSFSKDSPNYNNTSDVESHSAVKSSGGGSGSYETVGVTFHNRYMSNYSDAKSGASRFVGYDYSSEGPFNVYTGGGSDGVYDLESYKSKVAMAPTWITGKSFNDLLELEILTVNSWTKEHYGYDLYNVQGTTNNWFTINTFQLNNEATKALYNKLGVSAGTGNTYETFFSGILATKWGNAGLYNNAYDFYSNMENSWANSNYGFGPEGDIWTYDSTSWHDVAENGIKGQSVLNNFDNRISIPTRNRSVFVAHKIINSNENIIGIANTQLVDDSNTTLENQYTSIDSSGWQEKYITSNGLTTLSGNNAAAQIQYNGKTYECAEVYVYNISNNNSEVWHGNNVKNCHVDGANQISGDLGVVYYYKEVVKIDKEVQVYVNYIDQTTMTTVESFKSSLDETQIGDFTKIEPADIAPYPQKFVRKISGVGTISLKNDIYNKTTALSYNGKQYYYVGMKYASGSDYLEALRIGSLNSGTAPKNNKGLIIPSLSETRVYLISFYFKPGTSIQSNEHDPKVEGRLDFINTGSYFKGATYRSSDRTATELDYIPANEQLSPYIYGAQPYFIKAIDYGVSDYKSSDDKTVSVTLTGNWTEYDDCGDEENPCPGHAKSVNYTYTAKVKYKYNKIDNLITYKISNVKVNDSDSNIGGKLFNSNDSFTLSTSNDYLSRSNATITDHVLTADFKYSSTSTSSAGDNPSASAVANAVGLKLVATCTNDVVKIDNNVELTKGNEKSISKTISSQNGNEYTLDSTTSDYLSSNIDNYMKGTQNLTTYNDFNYSGNIQTVNASNQNGIRQLKGDITYSKVNVRGGNSNFTADKALTNTNDSNVIENNKSIEVGKLSSNFSSTYDNEGDFNADKVRRVNVLTPLSVNAKIDTENSVNHSNVSGSVLQTGKEFTLDVNSKNYSGSIYSNVPTDRYIKGYYITFDFKLEYRGEATAKVYNGSGGWDDLNPGNSIEANTDVYVEGSNIKFKGISTGTEDYVSAWSTSNHISVVAVTKSIDNTRLRDVFDSNSNRITSSNFKNFSNWIARSMSWGNFFDFGKYIDTSSSTTAVTNRRTLTSQVTDNLLKRNDLYASTNHAVRTQVTTNNIGRIFDFMVTDCTDLAYKNIFRKQNNSGSQVNQHTNNVYFSGKKYFVYSDMSSGNNEFMLEDANRKTLLPLGPYKNTQSTYIFAPKLGYRISFNVSTSGYYTRGNAVKRIEITPKYYYVSKSGKYIKDIKLYYKDSSGKYKEFVNSGYSIYFKPNDGYRYGLFNPIDSGEINKISNKLEKLNVSEKIVLNTNMMLMSNSGYIQTWFGEFKLPNSTIAVDCSGSTEHNNINNPLNDGYIGVVFDDMHSVESRTGGPTIETYYNQNDKTKSGIPNTSQWDYEGYMGVTAGQSARVNLQLEKGSWSIDDSVYQDIKGTVILYDLDNRAATDFN